jgi:hypothetical protein
MKKAAEAKEILFWGWGGYTNPLPDIKKITSMNIAIYGTWEQH